MVTYPVLIGEIAKSGIKKKTIADSIGVCSKSPASYTHLDVYKRQTTGYNHYEYLLKYRISRAKELLLSSRIPVGEIALAVGFSYAGNFVSTFKRMEGITPAKYRRQYHTMSVSYTHLDVYQRQVWNILILHPVKLTVILTIMLPRIFGNFLHIIFLPVQSLRLYGPNILRRIDSLPFWN